MTLTPITLNENYTLPRDVGYLSIGTGNTVGVTLSLSATAPATGVKSQVVEIISDTAYFWSYQDTQTAAAGTMVPVLAYEKLRVEVGPAALSLYMKASSGTAKMSVVQV